MFCLLIVSWLFFDKFRCVFYLCLKCIRYVNRMLISKFLGDENDLPRVYVMVDYNTLVFLRVWQ